MLSNKVLASDADLEEYMKPVALMNHRQALAQHIYCSAKISTEHHLACVHLDKFIQMYLQNATCGFEWAYILAWLYQ